MLIMPSFKKSLIVELFHGNYLKLAAILWHFPVMQWFQSVQVFKTFFKKNIQQMLYVFDNSLSSRNIILFINHNSDAIIVDGSET